MPALRSHAWLLLCALSLGASPWLCATSVDDILQTVNASISDDELSEPGSQVRAQAIAEMLPGLKLSASDLIDLKLALAEAWLDGLAPANAEAVIKEVLAAKPSPLQQERAGLAWVAAWTVRFQQAPDPAAMPSALVSVATLGDLGPAVTARAHTAEAQRLLVAIDAAGKPTHGPAALAEYDLALGLLKDRPSGERVPVYHLRLLAMEAMGTKPEAIELWLHDHVSDPAAAEVEESALTGGQKLIGQPAPAFAMKRLDGVAGTIGTDQFKGKMVLLDFFATWHQPSTAAAPALAAYAERHKADLMMVGVSLDSKDTIEALPGWITTNGLTYPVVGDLQGWDSDTIKAYHIDKIPNMVLIGPDGRIRAVDLIGATEAETAHNIDLAMAPPTAAGAAPATVVTPAVPAAPVEVPGAGAEIVP